MFASKIIEDLRKGQRSINKDIIETVISQIEIAHKFHMGEVRKMEDLCLSQISGAKLFKSSGFEDGNIHLPYPISYFDGFFGNYKGAMIFSESEIDGSFWLAISLNSTYDKWVLDPVAHIINAGPIEMQLGEFDQRAALAFPTIKRLGRYDHQEYTEMCNIMDIPLTEKNEDIDDDYYTGMLTGVHTFLLLMNCKNVATSTIPAPEKVNRRRIKEGKLPFYSYKVLRLEIPGQSIPKNVTHSEALSHYRLHFVRGHIKRYTSDKPLFGRFIGSVWISSHLRGDGEKGVINKDYSI